MKNHQSRRNSNNRVVERERWIERRGLRQRCWRIEHGGGNTQTSSRAGGLVPRQGQLDLLLSLGGAKIAIANGPISILLDCH